MQEKRKKSYYVFSPWLRSFHWIMVLSIITLFFTGLYIGNPSFGGFADMSPTIQVERLLSMENIRRLHFIAGFTFIASFILRIYGFIKNPGDRLFPRFHKKEYWKGLVSVIGHYLFIPQKHEGQYLRNSLARTAYFGVYFFILIEAITGIAMFSMITPNSFLAKIFVPIYTFIGGYWMHIIHHYTAWAIVFFVIGHVYLGFREDFVEKNGEISSMISGRKFYEEDPDDIGDIK